ncbi:N-carbamoyl-D-amino-acid hydrolase [Martelella mediterranea]|uniref:Putative amidohydrolase n=1 Tax=Martelella mediterranea TaxID=293089 RepID=A0A4R3P0N0_9HYPH|nr:N-carbamoyl-D-amino-acid hydrolase [Martelella mediterranea]TCT42137.1 putative amidohydrolase [Martelella mediterranea]
MSRTLVAAAAQMGPIALSDTRREVVARLIALLHEAASRGAELVVFPELTLTTFFPRWYMTDPDEIDAFYETEMPGRETLPLFEAAKKLRIGFYLGYAELVVENGVKRRFNTSILVDRDGEFVGKYRKIHLPGWDAPQPDLKSQHLEKYYFEPGDLGFNVFEAFGTRVGMAICNDRRWPETYRVMALRGSEMILVGYNTPDDHTGNFDFDSLTQFHNQLSIQAGAYQNSNWVIATAKAGHEEGSNLIGQSMIVAPSGQIVAMATSTDDEVVVAKCDLDMAALYRKTIFDFARHREPEHYRLIVENRGPLTS